MAEIKIRLIYNVESGKKDIYIDYESEDDALPIEHERGHREIIRKLLGENVLGADEVGEVVVERVGTGSASPTRQSDSEPPEQAAETG